MIACSKSRRKDPPLGCVHDARAPAGCQISMAIAALPTDYVMSAITPNAFSAHLGRWPFVWCKNGRFVRHSSAGAAVAEHIYGHVQSGTLLDMHRSRRSTAQLERLLRGFNAAY